MQATNPSDNYEFDRINAIEIYNLSPELVTLGIHPLSSGNSQVAQTRNFDTIKIILLCYLS